MRKYVKGIWCSLLAGVYVVSAYAKRPHSKALKHYGVRIVVEMDNPQQQGNLSNEIVSDGAYQALVLLERYDNEMFALIRRHIRIILIFAQDINKCKGASFVPTIWLYFISVLMLPVNFPTAALPIVIAGFLARQATLAQLKGGVAYFDRVNGPRLLELCRKQRDQTMEKLERAIRESSESASGTGNL